VEIWQEGSYTHESLLQLPMVMVAHPVFFLGYTWTICVCYKDWNALCRWLGDHYWALQFHVDSPFV
jgi:hypothetical protein